MALKKVWLNAIEHTIDIETKDPSSGSIIFDMQEKESIRIISYDKQTNILTFLLNNKHYKAHINDLSHTKKKISHVTLLNNSNTSHIYDIHFSPTQHKNYLLKDQSQKNNFTPALHAPLAGRVIKTFVTNNQCIKKDEPLLILESMKMENEILAPHDCQVTQIMIEEGDIVSSKQLLITFSEK